MSGGCPPATCWVTAGPLTPLSLFLCVSCQGPRGEREVAAHGGEGARRVRWARGQDRHGPLYPDFPPCLQDAAQGPRSPLTGRARRRRLIRQRNECEEKDFNETVIYDSTGRLPLPTAPSVPFIPRTLRPRARRTRRGASCPAGPAPARRVPTLPSAHGLRGAPGSRTPTSTRQAHGSLVTAAAPRGGPRPRDPALARLPALAATHPRNTKEKNVMGKPATRRQNKPPNGHQTRCASARLCGPPVRITQLGDKARPAGAA